MPDFGGIEQSEEILLQMRPQIVIVDLFGFKEQKAELAELIRTCRRLRIDVKLYSEFFEAPCAGEIESSSGCLWLRDISVWSARAQRLAKWCLDRAFGVMGSILTLLVAPLVWIAILLEDPGPLFHRREFVAQDGSVKYYLKFRTMVRDADQILDNNAEMKRRFSENHKLRHDPRVLRVGRIFRKFSIDEFPQFFSVLTGQLAFVGPRVISAAEKARYGKSLQKRLTVKPGLTGYWQVMGRQTTTYDERILMDMYYIDNWSIWMDLVIIAQTFSTFFKQEGAY